MGASEREKGRERSKKELMSEREREGREKEEERERKGCIECKAKNDVVDREREK